MVAPSIRKLLLQPRAIGASSTDPYKRRICALSILGLRELVTPALVGLLLPFGPIIFVDERVGPRGPLGPGRVDMAYDGVLC